MTAPPIVTELLPPPDPVTSCELLSCLPYRVFLDSALRALPLGRYSFLTADPVSVVRSKGTYTEVLDAGAASPRVVNDHALNVVRRWLRSWPAEAVPGLPPFQGGAAGFVGYEWADVVEPLDRPPSDDLAMPDVVIGLYDWVLAWDHATGQSWLISTGLPEGGRDAQQGRARDRASRVTSLVRSEQPSTTELAATPWPMMIQARGRAVPSHLVEGLSSTAAGLRSSFTREGYVEAVARVREYVCAGDIFQANLSQRFDAPLLEPAWDFYKRLRVQNAAPFAAFLDVPGSPIMSASPERFLRVDAGGLVETRPIKGTRPRGVDPEEDAHLGRSLAESAKDRAEHLMIVDLMRNDLSRVCRPGTVRVPELFRLEHYATVHHLVSTIVGQLSPDVDALALLTAAFPGGSVTGAPKIRAMQVIAELEPAERGPYCGSIGYWSLTGPSDTSIAIRTAIARDDRLYFSAGGGVTADSDPSEEYWETVDKARGIINAFRPA